MGKVRLIIIGIFILALLALAGSFFLSTRQSSEEKIIYKSNNSYFTIEKKDQKILEYYLDQWGFWKSENVSANKTVGRHTVKKIIIELTNKEQDNYTVTDTSSPPIVQAGSSSYIDQGDFLVVVYINPTVSKTLSEENMNKNILYLVMNELYYSTGNTSDSSSLLSALTAFFGDPEIRPFIINKNR